jgi:hypothetical protein
MIIITTVAIIVQNDKRMSMDIAKVNNMVILMAEEDTVLNTEMTEDINMESAGMAITTMHSGKVIGVDMKPVIMEDGTNIVGRV